MTATYDCIATTTLGSATNTVSFSSISGSYTDLIVIMNGGMNTTTGYAVSVRINGDSGSNYSSTYIIGDGSSASSGRYTNTTYMYLGAPARNVFNGNMIFHFQNYSNATTHKTVLARTNSASLSTWFSVGLWRSTSAITSISFQPEVADWLSGSTFSLYGIKAE